MARSILSDAFAHHVWATERAIDACSDLTREQLVEPAPGTDFGAATGRTREVPPATA